MQGKWILISMAAAMLLSVTAVVAQQATGCVPVNVQGMTDEQRAEAGYHYNAETGEWYAPDDNAARFNEQTGRWEDTSFPQWSYDAESGRWYDDARPGWSYDPLADRWFSEDRPNMAYDLRTGRWSDWDENMARRDLEQRYVYDAERNRWYDDGMNQQRIEENGGTRYYDTQMGRWREEPMEYRTTERMGADPGWEGSSSRISSSGMGDMGRTSDSRTRVAGSYGTSPSMSGSYSRSAVLATPMMVSPELGGEVSTRQWPWSLRPGGDVYFDVDLGENRQIDANTNVTAFLMPEDSSSFARYPVQITQTADGDFIGRSDITRSGDYILVVRISPENMGDRYLHYPVEIR